MNVQVFVNLANSTNAGVDSINRFNLYRTDAQGSSLTGPSLVALTDTGVGIDEVGGDFVFTAVLAVQSLTPGESLNFRAVPVIMGIEDRSSPFTVTSLNAILSFSQESGLGDVADSAVSGIIEEDAIDGVVLVVVYSWPNDQPDLDTGTNFLDLSVGYSCGASSAFLEFSGDDTSVGGTETVRVRLGDSYRDESWSESTVVEMHAGWFGSTNRGPASVTVYTERVGVDGSVATGSAVSFAYQPGFQTGCAATDVGVVNVDVNNEDESVRIQVIDLQSPIESPFPTPAPSGSPTSVNASVTDIFV